MSLAVSQGLTGLFAVANHVNLVPQVRTSQSVQRQFDIWRDN